MPGDDDGSSNSLPRTITNIRIERVITQIIYRFIKDYIIPVNRTHFGDNLSNVSTAAWDLTLYYSSDRRMVTMRFTCVLKFEGVAKNYRGNIGAKITADTEEQLPNGSTIRQLFKTILTEKMDEIAEKHKPCHPLIDLSECETIIVNKHM